MGYPNPNRTRKDPNRIRTEIQKYPNGAEIFKPENPKPDQIRTEPEWVPERPPLGGLQLFILRAKKLEDSLWTSGNDALYYLKWAGFEHICHILASSFF